MSIETQRTLPRLELVVAAARNGLIGRANGLPWHLPDDLKHFKRLTLGHPILMGRRTWDSLGRPLPGRRNLVLTRDPGFAAAGAEPVHSLEAALAACAGSPALMVIGGAEIFRLCLSSAQILYLTEVDAEPDGDTFLPPFDRGEWRELSREVHPADARHEFAFAFVTLERRVP
jgi:dihydrofolate reductase